MFSNHQARFELATYYAFSGAPRPPSLGLLQYLICEPFIEKVNISPTNKLQHYFNWGKLSEKFSTIFKFNSLVGITYMKSYRKSFQIIQLSYVKY